jgi:anaphase-promoting complex subunit 8
MNLKEIFASRLRNTVQQCQLRGLYQASTWAAEQLLGLEPDEQGNSTSSAAEPSLPLFGGESEQINAKELSVIMLSFPLIAQGQFQRCAFNIRRYGQEKSKLSKLGLFIYAYSHYMAGEKLKMQENQSDKGNRDSKIDPNKKGKANLELEPTKKVFNLNLPDLYKELLPFYVTNKMDGYLLYIFAVITRELFRSQGRSVRDVLGLNQDTLDPFTIFQQSLVCNPWNWSCWLEFEAYCVEQQCKIPTWDEMMTTTLTYRFHYQGNSNSGPIITIDPVDKQCGRAIYAFFLSHFYLEQHRGEMALPALEKLQKIFPTSLFLLSHIAVAHYTQRMYDQAEECFVQLRAKDPYRIQHMDTYSNILYVHEKTAELSLLAHHVVHIDKYATEVCCVIGNHYSLRGQHEKAVLYFQRALRCNPEYLSAWTLLGHEYMELLNTVSAIQCYRHGAALIANKHLVLDSRNSTNETGEGGSSASLPPSSLQPRSAGDFRAWYGLGQTYEMLHCHQYALYYYQKAALLRPDDARMWSAVGTSFMRLHLKAQAMAAFERAVYQCKDQEGVATRDVARLYHAEAGFHEFSGSSRTPTTAHAKLFMRKAAETYYLYLVISNQNNGFNIWPAPANDTYASEEEALQHRFPPASLDVFLQALKDVNHPVHAQLVAGDDFLSSTGYNGQQAVPAQAPTNVQVDAEQAEALLFVARYCQVLNESIAAQYFCSRYEIALP